VTIKAEAAHPHVDRGVDRGCGKRSLERLYDPQRPDEKYVTERAYDNPKFVEDMVRDVATR